MVKRLTAVLAVLVIASVAAAAQAPSTATVTLKDGRTLVLSYDAMDGIGTQKIVLVGTPARVKIFDKVKNSAMDACASKIVVTLFGKSDVKTTSSIKGVDMTGSPVVIHERKDPATKENVKITATGNEATYDGATDTVHFKGNVKITNEDPAMFDGPAEITGGDAWINLGKVGPDDVRFRISTSPGVSTITATPKSKEETKPNK